jgi:hypothetical protein
MHIHHTLQSNLSLQTPLVSGHLPKADTKTGKTRSQRCPLTGGLIKPRGRRISLFLTMNHVTKINLHTKSSLKKILNIFFTGETTNQINLLKYFLTLYLQTFLILIRIRNKGNDQYSIYSGHATEK